MICYLLTKLIVGIYRYYLLQVWRQINVMYQQMSESARALDKLHQQNEVYVNGTTSTMGGMESKVTISIIRLKYKED